MTRLPVVALWRAARPDLRTNPQASLLAFFCPVLRFDADEKHFPVCAETFISSSVLLRRPLTGHLRKQGILRQRGQADQQGHRHSDEHEDDYDDQDEDEDVDSSEADAESEESRRQQQQQQQQSCGVCGQRSGWSIPSKGGWELVALPSGSESWCSTTLLQEQRRDRLHEFRYDVPPTHPLVHGPLWEKICSVQISPSLHPPGMSKVVCSPIVYLCSHTEIQEQSFSTRYKKQAIAPVKQIISSSSRLSVRTALEKSFHTHTPPSVISRSPTPPFPPPCWTADPAVYCIQAGTAQLHLERTGGGFVGGALLRLC